MLFLKYIAMGQKLLQVYTLVSLHTRPYSIYIFISPLKSRSLDSSAIKINYKFLIDFNNQESSPKYTNKKLAIIK